MSKTYSFRLAYVTITVTVSASGSVAVYKATVADVTGQPLGFGAGTSEAVAVGDAVLAARGPFQERYGGKS